jgi:predicted RNA polymerase sigma factor
LTEYKPVTIVVKENPAAWLFSVKRETVAPVWKLTNLTTCTLLAGSIKTRRRDEASKPKPGKKIADNVVYCLFVFHAFVGSRPNRVFANVDKGVCQ